MFFELAQFLLIILLQKRVFAIISYEECEGKMKCALVPSNCGNKCVRAFTSRLDTDDDWSTMEIFVSKINPNTNYLAVGFSHDHLMGEEPVTHCAIDSDGNGYVHLSYNNGKSNVPLYEMDDDNVEMIEVSKEDGNMFCKFREKVLRDFEEKNPKLPVYNRTYHILFASGFTDNMSRLAIHSLEPESPDFPMSSEMQITISNYSFEEGTVISKSNQPKVEEAFLSRVTKRRFVFVHGILMLFAWFWLIASGIAAGRYLRNHWHRKLPGGLRIWYHLHRNANIIAVVLMIISFLFVFVAKDFRWTGPATWKTADRNTSSGSFHTIIGIVSIILAVLQPFGSLLRCAPDAKLRPIFNWAHRTIGLLSFILAVIAIIIAVIFFHVWSSRVFAILLTAIYLLSLIAMIVSAEMISCKHRAGYSIAFQAGANSQIQCETMNVKADPHRLKNLTFTIYLGFVVIALLDVIGLTIVIAKTHIPS